MATDSTDNLNDGDAGWLVVSRRVRVPLSEFRFRFSRSSGPGGQNVNKVSSRVTLLWRVYETNTLPPIVKERFLSHQSRRISRNGVLQLSSQRYRDQARNRQDCLDRLKQWLAEAATTRKPRKATKPSRASIQRRLDQKRQQSRKKRERRIESDE